MRTLQVTELSGPEGLRVDVPEPDDDQGIVIDVRAVGVSFPDLLRSQGLCQEQSTPPYTLGGEATGTAAIQVARANDCPTFAVVSSDEKAVVARQASADEVVRSAAEPRALAEHRCRGDVHRRLPRASWRRSAPTPQPAAVRAARSRPHPADCRRGLSARGRGRRAAAH
jgi:NADPH:quinone reductase-like Zn-dependent oxidoreductase